MEIGAILVGIALTAVVVAYLARPFRVVNMRSDQAIEAWVSRVRAKQGGRVVEEQRIKQGGRDEEINFCPQCGRRAGPDDRFCAGCGNQLQ